MMLLLVMVGMVETCHRGCWSWFGPQLARRGGDGQRVVAASVAGTSATSSATTSSTSSRGGAAAATAVSTVSRAVLRTHSPFVVHSWARPLSNLLPHLPLPLPPCSRCARCSRPSSSSFVFSVSEEPPLLLLLLLLLLPPA